MQWALIQDLSIKRLNIVDGAPVDPDFANQELEYFKGGPYEQTLATIFSVPELIHVKWYWKHRQLAQPTHVQLYKMKVIHHLRFCDGGTHHEDWIMGVFDCEDGVKRLAPLKRQSDMPIT